MGSDRLFKKIGGNLQSNHGHLRNVSYNGHSSTLMVFIIMDNRPSVKRDHQSRHYCLVDAVSLLRTRVLLLWSGLCLRPGLRRSGREVGQAGGRAATSGGAL